MTTEASLGRVDVAHGEWVHKEIDAFIERRHNQREKEEGSERPAEEMWRESERRQEARRRRELDAQWYAYHKAAAERHRKVLVSLVEYHEAEAERYGSGARDSA